MKNWIMPLVVFVAGSAGAVLSSERGRELLRQAADRLLQTQHDFFTWNDAAQAELERIQQMLNQIAQTLPARSA